MTNNLPESESAVNGEPEQLEFYPRAHSSVGHVLEIISRIDALFTPSRRITWREKECYALSAIDAVSYLVRTDACLCVSCLTTYAEEVEFLALCLRFEVLSQTGQSPLKIAHKSNVSE